MQGRPHSGAREAEGPRAGLSPNSAAGGTSVTALCSRAIDGHGAVGAVNRRPTPVGGGELRGGDDLLQRSHVAVEGGTPFATQPRRRTRALANKGLPDLDVVSSFERRELLRERRIGELHAVADKGEVSPVGGREQRHDREPRRGVNQLVEL